MEMNELRIFRAVAQTGSITNAAQALGYVQSNVTARIRQLEAELKTQLFYRQRRGMILTPMGEKLLVYAEKVINLLDEAAKAMDDSIEPSGSLAIGAIHTISSIKLPKILAEYHTSYPKVDLSLITSQSDELIYKVKHFQLDGAFINLGTFNDDNITKELVYDEKLVIISNPKFNSVEEVQSKPFLLNSEGCPYRSQLENWFKSDGIGNIRYMEFNNLNSIVEGVIADLGASCLPESSIKEYEKNGLIRSFPIPENYNTTRTYFIRRKDSTITSALAEFMESVKLNTPFRSNNADIL